MADDASPPRRPSGPAAPVAASTRSESGDGGQPARDEFGRQIVSTNPHRSRFSDRMHSPSHDRVPLREEPRRRSRSREKVYSSRERSPGHRNQHSRTRSPERHVALDRDRTERDTRERRRDPFDDKYESYGSKRYVEDGSPRQRDVAPPARTERPRSPTSSKPPQDRFRPAPSGPGDRTSSRSSKPTEFRHHAIDVSPPRSPATAPPMPRNRTPPPLPPAPATTSTPAAPPEPEKPNFGLSGALAQDLNTGNVYNGIKLKFSEPPDAKAPSRHWRLYIFKDGEMLDKPLHIHRSSAYLFGRERKVADIPLDHPSCSSQHAVLQYRLVSIPSADALAPPRRSVKPYLMDLEATNGTFLNGVRLEPARYYELREKDMITFGTSTREYILMCEESVK